MGFGIKQGGGRLNDVDGTITGYEFTTRKPGGGPKDTDKWVYLVLEILQDGSKEAISQHFFIGDEAEYKISKDGESIIAGDSPIVLGAGVGSGAFMQTVLAAGFPEDALPDTESGEDLEMSGLVGKRFRFVQVIDEKAMKKNGPRKVKDPKTGKVKEYPRTMTVVSAYYEDEGKGAAKGATKGKKAAEADPDAEPVAVLLAVLADATEEIPYKKLSMAVTRKLLKMKVTGDKDAIKDRILDEEFLGLGNGWTYNAKKQLVGAAEEEE